MAIGNVDITRECFPKHSRVGTARMKQDKETDEEGNRGVTMERSKACTKEKSPDGLSLPVQNKIIINIIWYYFTRYEKVQ